jgi:hypothetical protein
MIDCEEAWNDQLKVERQHVNQNPVVVIRQAAGTRQKTWRRSGSGAKRSFQAAEIHQISASTVAHSVTSDPTRL